MTRYQIFTDTEWLYPDSEIVNPNGKAELISPREADAAFQLLTDASIEAGAEVTLESTIPECKVSVLQLITSRVSENSAVTFHTTTDYDSVKDFVTRKAPFDVYDVTMPLDKGARAGRAAFYLRLDVSSDATPGSYDGVITVKFGESSIEIPTSLKVLETVIPPVGAGRFSMVNWIYYDYLCRDHNLEPMTDEFRKVLVKYLENELDMRNDCLMLPKPTPVRDESGRVIDFDFSYPEYVAKLALEMGFKTILGGFVARFVNWDDSEHFLLWDREVGVSSLEGYRQLKLYFTRAWESVRSNGWEKNYMQCLVDEPQFHNSTSYRTLAGICRRCMPGVKINDPVETTEIEGAVDIWVVKQAVYEKYLETFQALQSYGEEMWIYTCGYPANKTMNRVVDLPLTVSRLPMWMCFKYNCPGFLHWGYHYVNSFDVDNPESFDACCSLKSGKKYPPGNAHIVVPADGRPWDTLRSHAQRAGSVDYEMLAMLASRDKAAADELVSRLCTTFDDYDGSSESYQAVRRELMERLG